MSNAFVSTAKNLVIIGTDIDSVATAESAATKLSNARNVLDGKIDNARGQVAELILGQVPFMMVVLDNGGSGSKPAEQAKAMGIDPSHVSKMRTVGSVASFIAGGYDDESVAGNLTEAKAVDCADKLKDWWALEYANEPSKRSLGLVMMNYVSADGEKRTRAVQELRESFGSIEKLYNVAKGNVVHPDAPEVPGYDEGDDEKQDTWQGMLGRALDAARAQGATETEIMFVVRAFNNEV